jgi:hypothetical protein
MPMVATFQPPFSSPEQVLPRIGERGYAVLAPDTVGRLCGFAPDDLQALSPSWDRLAPDEYLKDGGRYRRRRHSCFVIEGGVLRQSPHRAHWQSLDYNALHGGMERWFQPIEPAVVAQPVWQALLVSMAQWCSTLKGERAWYVEAHQFRIDTTDGIGRPTPEGAHRDGVDFVAVMLIDRAGIKGGETRVFEATGPDGQRFTLETPGSLIFLDDARVIHESTPIQPAADTGHRDTLVLTYRAGGFQGAPGHR